MNSSEKLDVENNLLMAGLEVLDSPGNLEKNALSNWYTYHNSARGIITRGIITWQPVIFHY